MWNIRQAPYQCTLHRVLNRVEPSTSKYEYEAKEASGLFRGFRPLLRNDYQYGGEADSHTAQLEESNWLLVHQEAE